jgi:hypothetical protein
MCNRPKPFVVNYARHDVLNSFPSSSHFHCHYIASLPSEIKTARLLICDLIFETWDRVHLPVKILVNRQDIPLIYGEVWLFDNRMEGRMIHVYHKWLLGSV